MKLSEIGRPHYARERQILAREPRQLATTDGLLRDVLDRNGFDQKSNVEVLIIEHLRQRSAVVDADVDLERGMLLVEPPQQFGDARPRK